MPNRPAPNLADLPESTAVRVRSVTGRGLLRERLVELGFVTGVEVEVLRRAAFGGPLQVRVRGGTIGKHVRHTLDHYRALLDVFREGHALRRAA